MIPLVDAMSERVRNHPLRLKQWLDAHAPGWEAWELDAVLHLVQTTADDAVDLEDPALSDLIGALQLLRAQSERFREEWELFENAAHAFNGNVPDFTVAQPLSPAEAAFAVHVARQLAPADLGYEVRAYIEAVLHAAGLSQGVGPLEAIHDRSSHPHRREQVKARYEELLRLGEEAEAGESAPDVEAARLLAITLYLQDQEEAAGEPGAAHA